MKSNKIKSPHFVITVDTTADPFLPKNAKKRPKSRFFAITKRFYAKNPPLFHDTAGKVPIRISRIRIVEIIGGFTEIRSHVS